MPQARNPRAPAAPVTSWAARYGQAILRDGIASIPWALYYYQGTLDLAAHEIWFVACILAHKWDAALPYPRLRVLAAQAGLSERQLQKVRAALEARGLLQVRPRYDASGRQEANEYDFGGLFARLESLIAADPPGDNRIGALEEAAPPTDPEAVDMSFVARFGRVIAGAGVAAVPLALFTQQGALGLTPQQVWFVGYILAHRWTASLPYPSLRRMVARTGYSERQLHNIKNALVDAAYLRLVPRQGVGGGQDSNAYDFSGLFDAITAQLNRPDPSPNGALHTATARVNAIAVERANLVAVGRMNPIAVGRMNPIAGGRANPIAGDRANGISATGVNSIAGGRVNPIAEGRVNPTDAPGEPDYQGEGEPDYRAGGEPQFRRRRSRSKEPHQEADSSRRTPEQSKPEPPPTEPHPPYSPYVAGVVLDVSRELGDSNITANVTQALRLWQASGLDEEAFVTALRTAKLTVRQAQAHGIANKGAYWFAVLRDQLGQG